MLRVKISKIRDKGRRKRKSGSDLGYFPVGQNFTHVELKKIMVERTKSSPFPVLSLNIEVAYLCRIVFLSRNC